MKICSPVCVTRLSNAELCKLESQAASKRKNDRSSPGTSSTSPGNNPNDSTHESESSSSSAGSGWLRIRPTTSSRMSFHFTSAVGSCTMVILIRRWIPWCRRYRPRHGRSSLWSTTAGTYSPFGASSHISNHTSTSCLANTVDEGGHGKGPNLGLRTGWLMGMLGGNMRRGGGRVIWQSCLASLCSGWFW